MAFVFGKGFVLTGNFSMLTPEYLIPVAITLAFLLPGLFLRALYCCTSAVCLRQFYLDTRYESYQVIRLLLLLLVRCWLYSNLAVVTGVVPSSPRFLPSFFIAHRVQLSHCSSVYHRVLLTHALALSASQFVHKKKSPPMYTSMHSGGLELTKLTYTRLEDNLIRHRGNQ